MRIPHYPLRLLAVATLLVLPGCFKLSRESPRVQHYVLSGAVAPAGVAPTATNAGAGPSSPNAAGLSLGLRRLNLASYLAVPDLVVRRGVNEIVVSEFQRWGEDLAEGINRVVAGHLASAPSVRGVDVAPWATRVRHDFVLQLHVSRFEGVATDSAATEGRVHMTAGWDIIRPLDGRVLVRGSTDDIGGTWRVGDYTGLVTGLDLALARLARDITTCLSRFPNDSTPPVSCGLTAGEQR